MYFYLYVFYLTTYLFLDGDEEDSNCPMVKNSLLPGLRSFCSALKVCEEVCDEENLFEDGKILMSGVTSDEEGR